MRQNNNSVGTAYEFLKGYNTYTASKQEKMEKRAILVAQRYVYRPILLMRANSVRFRGRNVVQPIFSKPVVFSTILAIRLLSARYATIPDCDEGISPWSVHSAPEANMGVTKCSTTGSQHTILPTTMGFRHGSILQSMQFEVGPT